MNATANVVPDRMAGTALVRRQAWRFGDWPLRTKLLAAMIPLAVVPLLLSSLLSLTAATEALTRSVEQNARVTASTLQQQIEQGTGRVAQDTLLAANLAESLVYGTQPTSRLSFLTTLNGVSGYSTIDAYDPSGVWVAGTVGMPPATSPVDTDWFQNALNLPRGEVYFSDYQTAADGSEIKFHVATPVYRFDGRLLGVLRMEWMPTSLVAQARAAAGPNRQVDVLGRTGARFASTLGSRVGSGGADEPPFQWSRQQGQGTVQYDTGSGSVLAGYARITPPAYVRGLDWTIVVAESLDQALAPVTQQRTLALLLLAGSLLGVLLAAVILSRRLTQPAMDLAQVARRVQEGDLSARAMLCSHDELGRVAGSVNSMLDEITQLVQTREERDLLQRQIRKLLDEVSTVAEGDLTVQAEVTADVLGSVADGFNYMVAELRSIVENVNRTTVAVTASTTQIMVASGQLADQTEAQAERIVEATAAVEEMALVAQSVAQDAATGSDIAIMARHNASEGAEAVRKSVEGMDRIRGEVQETSQKIKRLGESSQEIGQIVELIEDIAEQTNLLALNAAIQAAMAGEHGRGFAVVADEVRRLADRATAATKQIGQLVRSIQADTAQAMLAMESSTREVVEGSRLSDAALQRLDAINQVVAQLSELTEGIARAAERQAATSGGAREAMAEISQTTHSTTAGTLRAAESVDYLANLAEQLRASVAAFRLGATEAPSAAGVAAR
jgi:methyl-accepting chemotaxis protein